MEGNILFVEDDLDICEIIEMYLRAGGIAVDVAHDARTAQTMFARGSYDLLLTDILLPDMAGTELARQVRGRSNIPIIFMSCKKESKDIVDGLELGADDYITKPFEPSVVVARVKAQLRRFQNDGYAAASAEKDKAPAPVKELYWHDRRLRIDPASCEVAIDGKPVALFAKERQLLLYLAGHPNQVFSVEQLYAQIWGWDRTSDPRTVMVHIRTLRKKIEENPAEPRYIVTVRGFGYKFVWQ